MEAGLTANDAHFPVITPDVAAHYLRQARALRNDVRAQIYEQLQPMKPKNKSAKFEIKMKIGPGNHGWKKIREIVKPYSGHLSKLVGECASIERELNNGLLAYEAQSAYARIKMHDKPVYKVHLSGDTWNKGTSYV